MYPAPNPKAQALAPNPEPLNVLEGPRTHIIELPGPKYYIINCIWALKPYYLGPWTLRALLLILNPKPLNPKPLNPKPLSPKPLDQERELEWQLALYLFHSMSFEKVRSPRKPEGGGIGFRV